MKIGIITYHGSINYGAFLQAYSLCNKLNTESGIDAEIIDYQMQKEIDHYSPKFKKSAIKHPIRFYHNTINLIKQKKLFENSRKNLKLSSVRIISDSIDDFIKIVNGKYDIIIAGSDEIWKTNGFRGFPTPYWLIGELNCRKFSYAASARNNFNHLSNQEKNLLLDTLSQFEFIGVRDKKTLLEVTKYNINHVPISLCCDPTFLWNFKGNINNGNNILFRRHHIDSRKKIIALMTEDITISKFIYKSIDHSKYELISLYQWQPKCKDLSCLDPFEWIDVISSSDLLITSFFHGVCFAIKLGIPMIAFGTNIKADKVSEIIEMTNRKEDFFIDLKRTDINTLINKQINKKPEPYFANEEVLHGYTQMIDLIKS